MIDAEIKIILKKTFCCKEILPYKILQFTFEPYYAILSMLSLLSIWY